MRISAFPTIKAEPKVVLSTTLHRLKAMNGPYFPLFSLQPQLQTNMYLFSKVFLLLEIQASKDNLRRNQNISKKSKKLSTGNQSTDSAKGPANTLKLLQVKIIVFSNNKSGAKSCIIDDSA